MTSNDWRGAAGRLPPEQLGFRIESFLDLSGWRVLEVPSGLISTQITSCPADGSPLQVFCTLAGDDGRLRVGCCSTCGHVTFIDRPSKDWLDAFYLEMWDNAPQHASQARAARSHKGSPRLGVKRDVVALATSLPIDRSRPICEIGCGHGDSLRHLELAGYARLVGVEPSRHRAAIAREAFGYDVLSTPFESAATQGALRSAAPFALIFSIHALEHTYEPEAVLRGAAMLQDDGDYLILSVPNLEGEPSVGVLMFLPHMHSFTPASLQRVAARNGYTLIDGSHTTAREINMVFRRGGSATEELLAAPATGVVDKVIGALQLDRAHVGSRRLHWSKRSDWAMQEDRGQEASPPDGGPRRTMIVSPLAGRRTEASGCPIELQFTGSVKLFTK